MPEESGHNTTISPSQALENPSTGEIQLSARDSLLLTFKQPENTVQRELESLSKEELCMLMLGARDLIQYQEAKFARMLDIGSALGDAFHIDDLLQIIVEKTTELMDAERSTLFLIDDQTRELWSKIVQGNVNIEIRLQLGQGIAGWVALTGKSLNIRDAYRDPRFNPKVDENTGYITRNILCQPIRNLQGDIIGVIQVLNRIVGNFTDEDENLLSAIASQAAIAIENSKLYLAAIERNMELIEIKDKLEHKVDELDMLYELERTLSRTTTLDEMIEAIFQKVLELVHAGAAMLTLREGKSYHVYLVKDLGEWQNEWLFTTRNEIAPTGLSLEAIRNRDVLLWSRELDEVGLAIEESSAFLEMDIDNAISVPLFHEDEVMGTLDIFNTINMADEGNIGFSQDNRKVIEVVASQLSGSLVERRRQEEEEKNQRLASIGQMLSGVLHDFKNPMAIISGYVQIMAKADDPDMRKTYAKNILKQFDQLNQMTRELLAFARGDRNILLRKVFLHKFIEDIKELLEPELQTHNVSLELDMVYRNEVWLDQVKMKRAILNLARNAAEAMAPEGGNFCIRLQYEEHDEEQDEILFVFEDTGGGIPEDIRENLFESFVTHGKKNGTGLGLAIVKKIVEDHQGTIDFVTELGKGTRFEIRLPAGAPAKGAI